MTDLVLKLFEGEHSDAEFESLEAQLASNPDEAQRLADEAERRYAAFGLPEPSWSPSRRPGKGLWFGAAGALALLVWGAWPENRPGRPDLGMQSESFSVDRHEPASAAPSAPQPAKEQFEEGKLLSVQVALRQPEMARVEVLDGAGRTVRRIYSGLLKAGDWAFHWDGKLESGQRPRAGRYTIVLKAGGAVQRRSLDIE